MGRIPEEIVAQVIDRCDIVDIIGSYVPLKKAGRNFKGLSPFKNEKTPSFVVSPDKQIFHCFSSGEGGNVITFIMKMERMEFPEAVRLLAEKANIPIPETGPVDTKAKSLRQALYQVNKLAAEYYHRTLLNAKTKDVDQARAYLKSRGITLEMVKKFKLGVAYDGWDNLLLYLQKKDVSLNLMEKAGLIIARDKRDGFYDRFRNRIIFPIFDVRDRCVAFGARSLINDQGAKYVNSPESEIYIKGQHLYGIPLAKDAIAKDDRVIIVEGYMDFVFPYQSGIHNVVASLGTALTPEQIRIIRRYTKDVVMLFDADQAGIAAMLRSCDLLIEEGMNVKIASLQKGEDPDSFLRKFGIEAFNDRINSAQSLFEYKLDLLTAVHDKSSIEGKAKICGQMIPTINLFDNAIVRSEYIKFLAQSLSLSQEAVMQEIQKGALTKRSWQAGRDKAPEKVTESKKRIAEYKILKILLEDPSLVSSTREKLKLSDFQNEAIREIINKIYEISDEIDDFSTAKVLNEFENPAVLQLITNLMAEDKEEVEDLKKMYNDCVNRIIGDSLKIQRQGLLEQIREAEIAGEFDALEELKKKFYDLTKK